MTVRISKMRTRAVTGKVKAYFTLIIDELEIEDMRLINGKNGLFVGFPSKKITKRDGTETYIDLVRPARDSEGKYTAGASKVVDSILKAATAEFERRSGESVGEEEDDALPF